MNTQIQQITEGGIPSLWDFLLQFPFTLPFQIFVALALTGTLGMFAHYVKQWIAGQITGSLFEYLFVTHPRRTLIAFSGVLTAGFTAITMNVFVTDAGGFVGWLNVLWIGLGNGFACDSIANKGSTSQEQQT